MDNSDAKMEKFLALKAKREKLVAELWEKKMKEKGLEPTDKDWELYQQANPSEDPVPLAVPVVPLAVPVAEAARPAPSAPPTTLRSPPTLRSFIEELMADKLSDYKYTWEGDTTLKLEHRDNDACLSSCAPACFQDMVWKVSFGHAWVVTDGLKGSYKRRNWRPWANKNAAMEITPVQAVFTQGKADFDAQGRAAVAQAMERGIPQQF